MTCLKRQLTFACLMLTAALLTGCANLENLKNVQLPELKTSESPEATAAPEPTQSPAKQTEAAKEDETDCGIVRVNISTSEELTYDPENGTRVILQFSDMVPHVTMENADAAAKINEQLGVLDDAFYSGDENQSTGAYGKSLMEQLAVDNFTYAYENKDSTMPLELAASRSVVVERADSAVISFYYNDYYYTGFNNNDFRHHACSFRTSDGSELQLSDVITDTDALIKILKGHDGLTDSSIAAGLEDGHWYLSDEGLTVITVEESELRTINDTSVTSCTVPYDVLENILKDEFFPVTMTVPGELSLTSQDDYVQGSTEILDMVSCSDGDNYILKADGAVYNIRIARVSYSDATGTFYETEELYALNVLKDSALQIRTLIPEGIPNIMICYTTSDGQRHEDCPEVNSKSSGAGLIPSESIETVG